MTAKSEGRRIIRDRHLTPEEVAEDNEVRRLVMEEFPPKNPALKFGRQLRQAREQQGLSPEQVAEKAGVSDTVVRETELGQDVPLSAFLHVASALGCQLTISSH
jgi:ribosome-binding protein aMBF1 (putative translation factor)